MISKSEKLRCAVVGCGNIAKTSHLPILNKIKEIKIVALCDQQLEVAEAMARAFKIPNVYTDFSSMLKQERLDFVNICSPPHTHFEFSIQSIQKQLHVLLEKPMALNTSEADKILSLANENKIKLSVVHNFLYHPIMQKAIFSIASGEIGDILSIHVTILEKQTGPICKPDHWSHQIQGGRLGDLSEHAIYLIINLLGKVKSLKAIGRKVSNFPWVECDELSVLLETEKGIGSFYISCNSPVFSVMMGIRGTRKSLFLNHCFMTMVSYNSARSTRLRDLIAENLFVTGGLIGTSLSGTLSGALGHRWYKDGHLRVITDFVRSIGNNTDPPATAEDSRECLRVFQEAWSQIKGAGGISPKKRANEAC
jgi:predicted dehydrogenase